MINRISLGWALSLFIGGLTFSSATRVYCVETILPHPIPTFTIAPRPPIHPIPPIHIFPCSKFAGDWIINANGYIQLLNLQNTLGTHELTGSMTGLDPVEGPTTIKGSCKGNHIEFNRVEPGQTYVGNIMERGMKDMAGVYNTQYSWFAIRK